MVGIIWFAQIFIFIPILVGAILYFAKNPTQIERARIIRKTPGGVGKPWYIIAEINGEEKVFRSKYYVFMNVSEGEEVTLWYRKDYCFRFSK